MKCAFAVFCGVLAVSARLSVWLGRERAPARPGSDAPAIDVVPPQTTGEVEWKRR